MEGIKTMGELKYQIKLPLCVQNHIEFKLYPIPDNNLFPADDVQVLFTGQKTESYNTNKLIFVAGGAEDEEGKTYTKLIIKPGYSWDGMSIPKILKPFFYPFMPRIKRAIPSLVHDALYEMMRCGGISRNSKRYADLIFYNMLIEEGISVKVSKLMLKALEKFGHRFTNSGAIRKTYTAP